MRIRFLVLCVYFLSTHSFADSIQQKSILSKNKTEKIKLLLSQSEILLNGNPTKANHIAKEALINAQNIKNERLMAYAHLAYGNSFQKLHDYKQAHRQYHKAKDILLKQKDMQGLAICCKETGLTYLEQGSYNDALSFMFDAQEIYNTLKDKLSQAEMNSNVGICYEKLSDYEKSLSYQKQALILIEKLNRDDLKALFLSHAGWVYFKLHFYNDALASFTEAKNIFEDRDDKHHLALTYSNIATVYVELNKLLEAEEYYTKALSIVGENENIEVYLQNILGLSSVYLKMGNMNKSEIFAKKSLTDARTKRQKVYEKNSLENLYIIYKKQRKSDLALQYYELMMSVKDSLLHKEKLHEISKLETNFEIQKERSEILALKKIELLQQEKINNDVMQRNLLVLGMLMLTGFGIYLVYSVNRQTKTNKELALKNKEIELQKNDLIELNEEIKQINEELKSTLDLVEIERKKSDTLLLNILPDSVAHQLKQQGYSAPQHYDSVSILFTDFVGFTNKAETLSAIELVKILERYFHAFDEICIRHNLEKIKTIGDAYMAAGGLPQENNSHPSDTVAAAMEMLEFVSRQNEDDWQIRVGIHTGPVSAGVIGKHKFAYDIWGDTVNLAARMEQSGEKGRINISEATYQEVKLLFKCVHRGKIAAKNKGEVDMYFVEGKI